MDTTLRDMEWVERTRKELGLTREDLRDLLLEKTGRKVSMRTLDKYCRRDPGRQDFLLVQALVKVLQDLTISEPLLTDLAAA